MAVTLVEGGALAALGLLAAASYGDLRRREIPDWCALGLAALFFVLQVSRGRWSAFGDGMLVALAVFGVGAGLFRFGLLGGGDVKLMSALALWAGSAGILQFVLLTSLAGGPLSLACLAVSAWRRRADPAVPRPRVEVPYGVAIALGAVPAILSAR